MTKVLDDDMREWLDYRCHYLKTCLKYIKINHNLFDLYYPTMIEYINQMRSLIDYPDREEDTCRQ